MPIDSNNEKLAMIDWGRPYYAGLPMIEAGIDKEDMWFFVYETIVPHMDVSPVTVLFSWIANIHGISGPDSIIVSNIEQAASYTANIHNGVKSITANF